MCEVLCKYYAQTGWSDVLLYDRLKIMLVIFQNVHIIPRNIYKEKSYVLKWIFFDRIQPLPIFMTWLPHYPIMTIMLKSRPADVQVTPVDGTQKIQKIMKVTFCNIPMDRKHLQKKNSLYYLPWCMVTRHQRSNPIEAYMRKLTFYLLQETGHSRYSSLFFL